MTPAAVLVTRWAFRLWVGALLAGLHMVPGELAPVLVITALVRTWVWLVMRQP